MYRNHFDGTHFHGGGLLKKKNILNPFTRYSLIENGLRSIFLNGERSFSVLSSHKVFAKQFPDGWSNFHDVI